MTRNIKHLAPLVGALLALGAMIASAASAHVAAQFTTGQFSTTIRGEKDGVALTVFRITNSEVQCNIETFHGTSSSAVATTETITPTYTECEAFGFAEAKMTGFGHYGEPAANRCDYSLRADNKLDLVCPAGRDVTYEVAGVCTVHYPAQTGLGTIEYTTGNKVVGSEVKHDLTLDVNLTGITVTHTRESFLCPFASGESSVATLTGKFTFWAQDPSNGKLVDLTWDATVA